MKIHENFESFEMKTLEFKNCSQQLALSHVVHFALGDQLQKETQLPEQG